MSESNYEKRGKLITIEGCEGVGKSSNIRYIHDFLLEQKIPVIVTREPGGTKMAEDIRGMLLANKGEKVADQTELLLMFAARSQHVSQLIKPALEHGTWVLSDRFTLSSYAYQGSARGIGYENIAWLENLVLGDLRPDLTLLLDAPIEIGMGRAKNRGALDRIELEQLSFFERVREGFLDQARANPDVIKVINASESLFDVQKQISAKLEDLLQDQDSRLGMAI